MWKVHMEDGEEEEPRKAENEAWMIDKNEDKR